MGAVFYLGWAIAVVLVAVGVYAIASPHSLAHRYGVSVEGHDAVGWVRATGIRDVALGAALGAAAYVHSLPVLVVLAVAGILVSHHGGMRRYHAAHGIHASGIVAFVLVLAMALFAIGR
jgi:prepilin signal peptidase PulO-like enzyme (type II secretory pathway)